MNKKHHANHAVRSGPNYDRADVIEQSLISDHDRNDIPIGNRRCD